MATGKNRKIHHRSGSHADLVQKEFRSGRCGGNRQNRHIGPRRFFGRQVDGQQVHFSRLNVHLLACGFKSVFGYLQNLAAFPSLPAHLEAAIRSGAPQRHIPQLNLGIRNIGGDFQAGFPGSGQGDTRSALFAGQGLLELKQFSRRQLDRFLAIHKAFLGQNQIMPARRGRGNFRNSTAVGHRNLFPVEAHPHARLPGGDAHHGTQSFHR